MLTDEKWPQARLIPISQASGVEAQERNAANVVLAAMAHVKEFGRAILKPLGAPAGTIQTFVEIPLTYEGKKYRTDGLIAVTRGSKSWVALVEVKVGGSRLELDQIHSYLDVARDKGYDAVLSISNHYVTTSQEYPLEVDKRRTRKVPLRHLSWFEVLTAAVVEQDHRGIDDPDQAYILSELIRYLRDGHSGVVPFASMGPGWTKVKEGARSQTLRKTDGAVAEIAARWDDLVKYVCLTFTSDLGRSASALGVKSESSTIRAVRLRESLAASGVLDATIEIPDASGDIALTADLRSRQLNVSTHIAAPRDAKSRGRIGWLLRQLKQAPGDARVEARVPRSREPLAATLDDLRDDPDLIAPAKDKEIRGFHISLARPMGLKRDTGKGAFIDSVAEACDEFYRLVLQDLRAWKPAPPKLRPKAALEDEAQEVAAAVAEPVEEAREEMNRPDGRRGNKKK